MILQVGKPEPESLAGIGKTWFPGFRAESLGWSPVRAESELVVKFSSQDWAGSTLHSLAKTRLRFSFMAGVYKAQWVKCYLLSY